jgi:predicted TIM-barrel fold metal-dependent hydrolase
MTVLDCHTHAWAPPSPDHPWVNESLIQLVDGYAVDPVYTTEKLLDDMDAVGIDEAVLVPFPLVDWQDNTYILESVREHDHLAGIVMLDPFADDAADRLRELMSEPDVIGFRIGCIYPRDHMWMDHYFDPGQEWLLDAIDETDFWDAARETDALVQLFAHREQLPQVTRLVDAHPDLTYAVDHLAHVDTTVPPDEGAFAEFARLAEYETVVAKLSEVPHLSTESFPYADVHDHVRWLLDRFGRERLAWGSDYPNISAVTDYERGLRWLDRVEGLSDVDREWLTGRSFRRHVGL